MVAQERLRALIERRVQRETPNLTPAQREELSLSVKRAMRAQVPAAQIVRSSSSMLMASPSPSLDAATERKQRLQAPTPALRIAPTPHIPVPLGKPQDDTWAVLARRAAEEEKLLEAHQRALRHKKEEEQRKFLDSQVEVKEVVKKNISQVKKVERNEVDELKKKWDEEQKFVAKEHRAVAVQLKSDREEQVELRSKKLVAEEQKRREADEMMMKRIEEELAEEKLRVARIKERELRHKEELIAANEEQRKRKEEARRVEAELEQKYAIAFKERTEKETRERQAALNSMKEKMKGREAMALALQATIEERAKEDELRAELVQIERERAVEEKKRAEAEKKKQALKAIIAIQGMQIEEKNRLREKDEVLKEVERLKAEEAVKKAYIELAEQKRIKRSKIEKQSALLRNQLYENNLYYPVVMSDEEKRLNQRLLQIAEQPLDISTLRNSPI